MIIDSHTHLIGSVDINLQIMEQLGITKAILLPGVSKIDYVKESEAVLEASRKNQNRFYPFFTVHPRDLDNSIQYLKKCLEKGFIGLKLHPLVQGVAIHDNLYDKLIEHLKKYTPVLIHTGTPVYSLPFQVLELAKRHPDITFIMGHSGLDYWYDAIRAAKRADNIILDTTGIRFPKVIEYMCKEIGLERIVYGSDLPFLSAELELFKIKSLNLSNVEKRKILAENILDILGR